MSAPRMVSQGQASYANKNYKDAIKCYSKALSLTKGSFETQLKVLDLRCQSYTKLGKHGLALQDARNMVHLSKRQAPIGYLRCAQIEKLSGDYVAAARWLEHGSKNVPQHRHVFETQLRNIQETIGKRTTHQKQQDPIASVPLEILQYILSYFEYREIVALLRVSRTWRSLLSKLKPLTTSIDLSSARTTISHQACNAAFRRLCRHPQTIILHKLSHSAVNIAQTWFSKYPNLETLEALDLRGAEVAIGTIRFDKFHKLKKLQIAKSQRVSLQLLFKVITQCQSLEDVLMEGIGTENLLSPENALQSQLKHLKLYHDGCSTFALSSDFLKNYPNIQSLTILGGFFLPNSLDLGDHAHLRKLQLRVLCQAGLELRLPASLEELSCTSMKNSPTTANFLFSDIINLPRLRNLVLQSREAYETLSALDASLSPPRLDRISLYQLPKTTIEEFTRRHYFILQDCRDIMVISEELRDSDCSGFGLQFPSMEVLSLEAPHITGVFISDLVKRAENRLKEIYLKDCHKVCPDVQPWLKSRGIKCQITANVSDSNDLRRIRQI